MVEAAGGGVVGRIYGNLGLLLGGKAAAGLISLAYIALAARDLGPADYGVLILVHAYVMTVGGIIEFPGWHAVVRYGAQAMEAGDRPRLTRLLAFAGLVETAAGLLAVAIAALVAPWLGPRLGWSPPAVAFALPYSLAVLASIRATPVRCSATSRSSPLWVRTARSFTRFAGPILRRAFSDITKSFTSW